MDDVVINKAASIERCLARVREDHAGDDRNLDNQTRQDANVLNLQRACAASIDLAMHLVRHHLGVPQETREAFDLLAQAGLLPALLTSPLKQMVGFRNVAVHEYRKLDLAIVREIIATNLADLEAYANHALRSFG